MENSPAAVHKEFFRSIVWTFAAPCVIAILTLAISYLFGLKHPFSANFGTADTLSVAAIILISVKQDIEKIPGELRSEDFLLASDELLLLASIVLWVIYGAFKLKALTILEQPPTNDTHNGDLLLYFGIISLLLVAMTVTYGIYVRYRIRMSQLAAFA
jgi:hypothetical protein